MFVVMATSEVAPLARTGGLGDVLGALPPALRQHGVEVAVIMPCYNAVLQTGRKSELLPWTLRVPLSDRIVTASVRRFHLDDGTPVYAIENDVYFARPEIYGPAGGAYADNAERFAFFSRAVLAAIEWIGRPDIVHCHDWPTGLVPAFLHADSSRYAELTPIRTALTIHNLGYQGDFWHLDWHLLNLDWRYFRFDAIEAWGRINYLKAGISFADAITTVSPTYAREIQTPELGQGLDGALRARTGALTGILNGVDYSEWSPEHDPHIASPYSAKDLNGKAICKSALQDVFRLPRDARAPLLGIVTRLAEQKGLDLLLQVAAAIAERGSQLVVVGRGDRHYERELSALAAAHPRNIGVQIAFDNTLAHQVEAGSDLFLMPSRYEPCGLNQMYSLRYGTIPVVRATGGLDDSVIDVDAEPGSGTGFKFGPYSSTAFLSAIDRALACYADAKRWQPLVRRAMQADFSWNRSARAYIAVYEKLLGH